MITKHRNQARLRSYSWYLNIRPVVAHDRFELFDPFREQPIEFTWEDRRVARNDELALCISSSFHPVELDPFEWS